MTKERTPNRSNLKTTQILASALAAVTAALLGSRLGSAGTLVGAAIGSVVTQTASTVYLRSLERARTAVSTTPWRTMISAHRPTAISTIPTGTGDDPPGDPALSPDARAQRRQPHSSRVPWVLAGAGALVAFVLAVVVLTGLESVRGTALSGGNGTTLGHVLGGSNPNRPTTTSTPTPTTSPPATTGTPTPTPSGILTPSANPTPTGSAPPSLPLPGPVMPTG